MKTFKVKDGRHAFTALELAVVISMIALTMLLLLSAINRPRVKIDPVICSNNLRQVGLAFRMWGDDNGAYPMLFRTNNFDGPGFASQQKMYVYYQVLSNELNDPKIVACPTDHGKKSALNFSSSFSNSNVSYFVGFDADETRPNLLLAGDRHIDNGAPPKNGLLDLTTNHVAYWTKRNHDGRGNVALADGSSQEYDSRGLQKALENTGTNLIRLAMP